jgi:hypothetical protein
VILNSLIFAATIAAAKTAAANRPEIIRAINRAVVEITKAAYWSFDGETLAIQSTTSKKLYKVDAAHTCEAKSKVCKHHIARLLMIRYSGRLATAPVAAVADERAALLAKIETAWSKYTCHQIGAGLIKRFGVNQLAMLPDYAVRQIAAAIR